MNTSTESTFAIMFADVSGSTRLYEALGDTLAKSTISGLLNIMIDVTSRFEGQLIKTIGDEIMCRFNRADDALNAAVSIQEQVDRQAPVEGNSLAVRIGFHYGPALLQDDGDVFGDAVNLAARMAGIARARQIITTGETASHLSAPLQQKTRAIDQAPVKGKSEPVIIHEVLWEQADEVTTLAAIGGELAGQSEIAPMTLFYRQGQLEITPETAGILVGRGDHCQLQVPAPTASRAHARIDYRRGKYILVDQSTNGTFVKTQDGQQVYLRREELPLWGKGAIGLGEEVSSHMAHPVTFEVP